MPAKSPALPKVMELPELEADDAYDGALPVDMIASERMSAEADVCDSLEDFCGRSFEDAPHLGPLDFDGVKARRHH